MSDRARVGFAAGVANLTVQTDPEDHGVIRFRDDAGELRGMVIIREGLATYGETVQVSPRSHTVVMFGQLDRHSESMRRLCDAIQALG